MPIDPQVMMETLSLLEELYAKVPVFLLENDRSEQGVMVAFEALTGKNNKCSPNSNTKRNRREEMRRGAYQLL